MAALGFKRAEQNDLAELDLVALCEAAMAKADGDVEEDPGFGLDRFLAAASRWVLPKRLPHGRSGRGVRPTAMAPARLHAGIHRRRAAGLNADDDATP
ncbi:g5771 [Coccomyxa elongata]